MPIKAAALKLIGRGLCCGEFQDFSAKNGSKASNRKSRVAAVLTGSVPIGWLTLTLTLQACMQLGLSWAWRGGGTQKAAVAVKRCGGAGAVTVE